MLKSTLDGTIYSDSSRLKPHLCFHWPLGQVRDDWWLSEGKDQRQPDQYIGLIPNP